MTVGEPMVETARSRALGGVSRACRPGPDGRAERRRRTKAGGPSLRRSGRPPSRRYPRRPGTYWEAARRSAGSSRGRASNDRHQPFPNLKVNNSRTFTIIRSRQAVASYAIRHSSVFPAIRPVIRSNPVRACTNSRLRKLGWNPFPLTGYSQAAWKPGRRKRIFRHVRPRCALHPSDRDCFGTGGTRGGRASGRSSLSKAKLRSAAARSFARTHLIGSLTIGENNEVGPASCSAVLRNTSVQR